MKLKRLGSHALLEKKRVQETTKEMKYKSLRSSRVQH